MSMHKILLFTLLSIIFSAPLSAQSSSKQAKLLNEQAELAYEKFTHPTVHDSAFIYRQAIQCVELSMKSDSLDRLKDKNGEAKPKLEHHNSRRLHHIAPQLIDAALFFDNHSLQAEAISSLQLYIKAAASHLMKGRTDETCIAAYYLAQIYLRQKDFAQAMQYAGMAMSDDETAQQAAEVIAQCMAAQMKTATDSANYLKVISQLYESDPTNETYLAWLMRFFENPEQRAKLENFVDTLLLNHPDRYKTWILKGEIAMHAERWEEAADAYKQADKLKPNMIPILYNIGVALNRMAMERRELAKRNNNGKLTTADSLKVRGMFMESAHYLEKLRRLDPHRRKLDWAIPLFMAYQETGNEEEAKDVEKLIKEHQDDDADDKK